jgi:hypothetical protein
MLFLIWCNMYSEVFKSWGKLPYGNICRHFSELAKSGLKSIDSLYPRDYIGTLGDSFVHDRVCLSETEWKDNEYLNSREEYLKAHEMMIASYVGQAIFKCKDSVADMNQEQKAKLLDAVVRYADKLEQAYDSTGRFFAS